MSIDYKTQISNNPKMQSIFKESLIDKGYEFINNSDNFGKYVYVWVDSKKFGFFKDVHEYEKSTLKEK